MAVAASALLLLPATAAALEHPFLGNLGELEEPSFEEAQGMAVDQASGDVLVLDRDADTLSRWHSDGTASDFSALSTNMIDVSLSQATLHNPGEVQVAVDSSCALHEPPLSEVTTPTCAEFDPANSNIYVAEVFAHRVGIYGEDGNFLGSLTEYDDGGAKELKTPIGVAVDPVGNIYVDTLSNQIHKYEPTANPPVNADSSANFPFTEAGTIAAGAGPVAGFIFPIHFNGPIAKLDSATGEQKYVVDPDPTATATIDPVAGTLYTASGTEVREFDVTGESAAVEGLPISPSEGEGIVTGVAADGNTGRIYVARRGNPNVEIWGPVGQLAIAITEAASVAEGKVTLRGTINANEGPEATCEFQYQEVGTFKEKGFKEAPSEECSPAGPFTGTANNAVSATVSISSLPKPEGAYRYRLVAENEDGSKPGNSLVFQTFGNAGLPDERAYELVSPAKKAGEVVPPEPVAQLGGSCGNCLPGEFSPTMAMQSSPGGDSVLYLGQPFEEGLSPGLNEYVAPRSASGWGRQNITTPTMTGQFVAFSEDLGRGILAQLGGDPPLSPQAPVQGGKGFANLYLVAGGGAPVPLITSEPPNRDVGNFNVQFSGANAGSALVPGFEHVIFEANDALGKEEPEVDGGPCTFAEAECNLYEWIGGELRLVNVLPLPSGEAAGGAVIGAGRLLTTGDPAKEAAAVDHAISEDGSKIFWSSEESGEVYVRIDGTETLQIPGPGTCSKSVAEKERACFLTATPDGAAVLLSDGTLYELNEAEDAYEEIADLTLDESEVHQGGFQGILGAAEDLSRAYFIDTAALTGEDEEHENANKEHAEKGKPNLYLWEEGEEGEAGEATFIGMLAAGDNGFGTGARFGAWKATTSNRTAQVSADGNQLAFMSIASLTGYDNTRSSGECPRTNSPTCQEVFSYEADSRTLSCASCNPSGEQPLGYSNLSLLRPQAPFPQPRNLARDGSGRLFFESQDALLSADNNGRVQDVYEWEPEGVGSCDREGGCVYLISSGHSSNDSMFLDASEDGDNAFFITRQQLVPQDKNEQLDLYDARKGGGFPEEGTAAPCSPETCAGPLPSAPGQPSAASAGFDGPGNPKPKKPKHCKAGFVKKNGKCVKKNKNKKNKQGGSR